MTGVFYGGITDLVREKVLSGLYKIVKHGKYDKKTDDGNVCGVKVDPGGCGASRIFIFYGCRQKEIK